jgi:hypothetical protein
MMDRGRKLTGNYLCFTGGQAAYPGDKYDSFVTRQPFSGGQSSY